MAGKVIALTARSEAGKDYLADYLVKHHGWKRESFSDSLKEIAHNLFPWCDRDYPPEEKNSPINHLDNVMELSPREVWKGIDHLREVDPHIFAAPTIARVEALLKEGHNVVITDVRKEIEADHVEELGAYLIRIRCDKETDYRDEDIIDSFNYNAEFYNDKRTLHHWVKFCTEHDLIQDAWVNVLNTIVDEQVRVSAAFSPNWLDATPVPSLENWRVAAAAEYAEFLEEVACMWKWWKPTDSIDKTKTTEEFADFVMFSISRIIAWAGDVEVGKDLFLQIGASMDFGDIGIKVQKNFNLLHDYCNVVTGGTDSPNTVATALIYSIDTFCTVFDVKLSEFVKVYMAKHDLNMQRHESGYQETGNKEGLEQIIKVEEPRILGGIHGGAADLFVGESPRRQWDPFQD